MNLYNLKHFADAARLKSMTKAAELNHLSRPAISQSIQKLEADLGVKLLVHKRRSFNLTQAGISLMKRAPSLFLHIDELKSDLITSKGPMLGEFRIGSSRALATFHLPNIMSRLRKHYPAIDFKIVLANSEELIKKLSNGEIDMIFFIGEEALNDFKHVVISRGYFCLTKPKDLSLNATQYAITELRPETERLKTLYERNFGTPLPVFAEIQSWDAIWTWVTHGICGGLLPDFMTERSTVTRTFSILLPKVFPYEIKAMYPKTKINHPIVKSFIEAATEK